MQERRNHGHDFVDYPNPLVDWGATSLAVQFRLGLLAKWRIRLDSFDYNYSRLDGTPLRRRALVRENGQLVDHDWDGITHSAVTPEIVQIIQAAR
jgi:hypothetical protein